MASEAVKAAIARAAIKYGVDPQVMMRFAQIESGMRPTVRTGSYKGLFQLSDSEFRKHGGSGDIYDVEANANAGAAKIKAESEKFKAKYGREPSAADLYMVHQQGEGGYAKHSANPDAPAWQNMHSTAEGRTKGPGWSKQAIWGNIPDQMKSQFGSVDNVTSKQFTEMWAAKVNDGKFDPGTMVASAGTQPASSAPSPPTAPQEDKGMLNLLAALGGSGSAMAGLGKGLGMQNMAQAGGQNSVFGALGSLFGGGGGSEGGAQGGGGNPGMALAQNAMTAAAGSPEEEQQKGLQRKPIDLQMLSKILQQRGALGTGGVKPGGLGVG
jgi:hypothetical protein